MKQWNLHKAAALAVILGALLPACGFFSVQNDVSVKRVSVDLAFGAQSPSPQPSFLQPTEFANFSPPVLPTPTRSQYSPPPEPELCPPTTDVSADPPVVTRINYDDDPKTEDHVVQQLVDTRQAVYMNAFDSSFQGKADKAAVNNLWLRNFQPDEATQPDNPQGYFFTMWDEFNGVGITFFVSPGNADEEAGDSAGEGEAGIYLKWIDIPDRDPLEKGAITWSFRMERPFAKIIDFGVSEGQTLTRSNSGVVSGSTRGTILEDPTGEGDPVGDVVVPGQSAMTITSTTKVGPAEPIPVCADLGHGQKVTWDLEISGEFNQRMIGTFWFATQFGGFPIKSDYIMFGDGRLIEGAFSNNIMRLKPEGA